MFALVKGEIILIKRLFSKSKVDHKQLPLLTDPENIPQHIAIIMDGNGRWAKSKGLPRTAGHHAGMKIVKSITIKANELGVKILTLYAFSTENWVRPKEEVDFLMRLPQQFFESEIDELMLNNVKVSLMGDVTKLPHQTRLVVEAAVEKTKNNTGLILNFALNYGGRHELVEAMKKMAEEIKENKLQIDDINEQIINKHLYTASYPDPDLLIRTSGELRLSNFMLWQLAYSEFYFVDENWPNFTERHLVEAINEYQRRTRRYGGV